MSRTTSDSNGNAVNPEPRASEQVELIDVKAVALLLGNCSTRHIYRLADAGHMPRSIRLGSLVRWRRAELLSWIDAGCPRNLATKKAAK